MTLTVKESVSFNIDCLKPILKWVGGKTQIIDKLIREFPVEIKNYHEIFLGGGSVLLALLTYADQKTIIIREKIYAYDINESLIWVYKNIQTNHSLLYIELKHMIDIYSECPYEKDNTVVNRKAETLDEAVKLKENYYYWIRNKYNTTQDVKAVTTSAMFIFLNKTCFRGLYRVGPNGFNVPFGNYKSPEIINKEHLDNIHLLIKNVEFIHLTFKESLVNVKKGDFVYLDPPYAPINNKSFTKYTKEEFKHDLLFKSIHSMTNKNINILMSNADVQLVTENFEGPKYSIQTIECKRRINSKNPESTSGEVLIKNY